MGDKNQKCFVPRCNNTVGVLFPKSPNLRAKWLKGLGLQYLIPGEKSFICLEHFGENGQPTIRQKTSSQDSHDELTSAKEMASLTAIRQKVNRSITVQTVKQAVANNPPARTSSKAAKANSSNSQSRSSEKNTGESSQESSIVYSPYERICRLCMTQSSDVTENVFNKFDEDYTIAQVISICLHPLQIQPGDKLSKKVCQSCIQSLKSFFKFHQNCMLIDKKQQKIILQEQEQQYHSDGNYADSEHSEEYLHEERLSDYEEDKENKEEFGQDNLNGQVKRLEDSESTLTEKNSVNKESSPMQMKYDKGEEELLKVLEGKEDLESAKNDKVETKESPGKLPRLRSSISDGNDDPFFDASQDHIDQNAAASSQKKDGEFTENIIIEMVNDEPPRSKSPPLIVDTSKLPITIKRVGVDPPKTSSAKRIRSERQIPRSLTVIQGERSDDIVILPSGISVQVKEPYRSPIGSYKSEVIKYLFNYQFLLAGGYLYDFRLIKDHIRRLHCIVRECPGTAHQLRIGVNDYSENIDIIEPHNHEVPDRIERKKQMFYQILYSKMRRDKNFNFKLLYDEFCKLDPDLSEILPLKAVVKEICKQGPAPRPPNLKTFNDFYRAIEGDKCDRYHFTTDNIQFYQEKFETEDGAKAVVFGNRQVISKYSYSQLMYVDASFVIESDGFPFQLVTVLVWVDQSYYPIFHAFVNEKSLEIYKKIFGFLYNELAPKLRPHEVITDYEANLYYALGETYVESSIGGAMFYFTQNIYKKICALGLARELELNSNFRSIYNMLLMLPLLPVNTILDGLANIENQAKELDLQDMTAALFEHVYDEWIHKVTPELFCVHRLENRINENIVAPFKKLRDLIMLAKGKPLKNSKPLKKTTITTTIENLIELDQYLRDTYNTPARKTSTKDMSSAQKKYILKAWNYIENHPMININQFFLKVLGYIKCMENQLWIWGFYRFGGSTQDTLIDASNFSIENGQKQEIVYQEEPVEYGHLEEDMDSQNSIDQPSAELVEEYYIDEEGAIRKLEGQESNELVDELNVEAETTVQEDFHQQYNGTDAADEAVIMEAVVDENGSFVLDGAKPATCNKENSITRYVYK